MSKARSASVVMRPRPASSPVPARPRNRSISIRRPTIVAAKLSARSDWVSSPRTDCVAFATSALNDPDSRVAMSAEQPVACVVEIAHGQIPAAGAAVARQVHSPGDPRVAGEARIDVIQRKLAAIPAKLRVERRKRHARGVERAGLGVGGGQRAGETVGHGPRVERHRQPCRWERRFEPGDVDVLRDDMRIGQRRRGERRQRGICRDRGTARGSFCADGERRQVALGRDIGTRVAERCVTGEIERCVQRKGRHGGQFGFARQSAGVGHEAHAAHRARARRR